jgi:hypothetical protein
VRQNALLGKKSLTLTGVVFVLTPQAFELLQENTHWYGVTVSDGLLGGVNRFAYVGGNPISRVDPTGQFAMVIPFIPAIITGTDLAIGAGLGALGYGLDRMFNVPARGLPPEGINPPTDGQCKPGPASRPSERDKGGQSLWDPTGGEWRWSPGDKWHNPHWDQNPHDRPSSPWVNVPHGGLPPVKQ